MFQATPYADARIERLDFAPLRGERPRAAGKNARLDHHGKGITVHAVRVTAGGVSGYGWSRCPRDEAAALVGQPVTALLDATGGARVFRPLEYPLLDWLGRATGTPVYRLAAPHAPPPAVPCYDTSLYMDDLDLADDADAVDLLRREARAGMERGHTAFKLKVGRGARHMEPEAGMRRDIAIVRGVREETGPDAVLMLDANNGLNLNLTQRLLAESADTRVFWMEEAFHEDPVLYQALRAWLRNEGLDTLIADGEGDASPHVVEWARSGLIDVVQHDVRDPGFGWWLDTAPLLHEAGAHAAPHNYGGMYGNYAACHLAPALPNFLYAEWDEATVPGIDASAYSIRAGRVHVPDAPGFGLAWDAAWFTRRAREDGWSVL